MDAPAFSSERRLELEGHLKKAFTPYAPVNEPDFFRGRIDQIRAAADTVTTPGLHAVIYGERGVGKTSLANILTEILESVVGTSRVNCAQGDNFTSVIRRSLGGLKYTVRKQGPGFVGAPQELIQTVENSLPQNGRVSPDTVADQLSQLPQYVVLVVDEFDRLEPRQAAAFADLLKAMSDRGTATTIVLVGVAENINQLISDHASVERCIRQVQMPRMSDAEVIEVIDKGYASAGFSVDAPGRLRILSVAQGFPHYAHLLAQNAGRAALDDGRTVVQEADVVLGMNVAVEYADQTHRDLYHKAVTGTKKQNLWKEVVAACALAQSDERGFFASRAVQERLSQILNRTVIQQTVAFHLGKLTEGSRGPLLQRIGPERRYRYRFINPLMRPFVLMKSMADHLIEPSLVGAA